jgi:peptide/nickel transport system permease protein
VLPEGEAGTAEVVPAAVLIAAGTEAPVATGRRRAVLFWVPVAWIVLLGLAAVLAPFLPLKDPLKSDFAHLAARPFSAGHLLGTDELGRDVLSRLVWGSRVALTVGVVAVGVGMVVGGTIGLVAGYYRGWVESLLMAIVDVMLAFPALVLVIAVTAMLGQSLRNVSIAVAVVATPTFARVTRGATLTFAQRDFVTAAKAMGARNRRIIVRDLLPNVALPVVSYALVVVAVAIVAEGALAFLGLSVPKPKPSWGAMISDGRSKLDDAPFISLVPAAAMFVTVLSFNLAGDRVRRRFDRRGGAL